MQRWASAAAGELDRGPLLATQLAALRKLLDEFGLQILKYVFPVASHSCLVMKAEGNRHGEDPPIVGSTHERVRNAAPVLRLTDLDALRDEHAGVFGRDPRTGLPPDDVRCEAKESAEKKGGCESAC